MKAANIGEHGIIGNMRSAALVNVFGGIDFFCFPEFDSPSVFASLLDTEKGGCFSLGPDAQDLKGNQFYLPDTNVLLTRFLAEDFILEVCDFMPVGETAKKHCLMRQVKVLHGETEVKLDCRPALDYARTSHQVSNSSQGIIFTAESKSLPVLRLVGSVPMQVNESAVTALFRMRAGDSASFIFGLADEEVVEDCSLAVKTELERTIDYWVSWAAKSQYKGRWREMVMRSGLTLKLLTSREHGSIIAAPTFGLPEAIGGIRNWDYRYVWMRDASFTTYAFNRLGYVEEGRHFERWLEGCLMLGDGERGPLNVMYRVDGSSNLDEIRLEHLTGHRGSRPVLIGNAASGQLQLDIYGELIDSVYLSSKYGDGIPHEGWLQMKSVLRWLEKHWQDPDEGIWEVRGGRKEFLHSRLMCWVAFDRAIRLGEKRSLAGPFDWMERCRDAIVADIHENFWNGEIGAFVQYKGAVEVDASTLLMPLLRFISVNDPRWLSTLNVIERELAIETTVRRYSSDNSVDGLSGHEGSFIACAFWLVEAKARSHQVHEARLLFEKLISQANPLGLYAEEMSIAGEHLGNFPQGLSHLALISAATYLNRCMEPGHKDIWS